MCARREHATHRVGHLFALDMKFLARSMPPVQLVYLGRSPRTWTWGGVRDEQVARELGAREGVRAARHYLRAGMPAFLARRDVRHLDRRVARMKVSRMVRFLVTFNVWAKPSWASRSWARWAPAPPCATLPPLRGAPLRARGGHARRLPWQQDGVLPKSGGSRCVLVIQKRVTAARV